MKLNRLLSALLALCLLVSLAACSALAEEPDYDEVFAIVHTNDVHGFIDVEPYVKAVADDLKSQYGEKNVLTVSAGDVFSGGNAVAHLFNGETIPPIMDAAGYDILVPGNNDFYYGVEQLQALAGMFEHTRMLCANFCEQALDENGEPAVDEDGNAVPGDPVFEPTMTVETAGGVRIGLFGLTTSMKFMLEGYAGTGSVEGAREAVRVLQAAGCAAVVGIGHTGWNDDLETPATNDVTSAQLVGEVPGIDKGKIFTLNLYDVFAIGCDLHAIEMTGEELLSRLASMLVELPSESPAFCQISGAAFGYLREYALTEEDAKIYTIINPTVGGEPLNLQKTYRVALAGAPGELEGTESVVSTMEEAAAVVGDYLKSGEAVILPDVPVPDNRIVPMDEIPAEAVTYEVEAKAMQMGEK